MMLIKTLLEQQIFAHVSKLRNMHGEARLTSKGGACHLGLYSVK